MSAGDRARRILDLPGLDAGLIGQAQAEAIAEVADQLERIADALEAGTRREQ